MLSASRGKFSFGLFSPGCRFARFLNALFTSFSYKICIHLTRFNDMHQSSSSSDLLSSCSSEFYHFHRRYKLNDDGYFTMTSIEQKRVEDLVEECFIALLDKQDIDPLLPSLLAEEHALFLRKGIVALPRSYEGLDASRPWLTYWILHSLELLNEPVPKEVATKIIEFLRLCQCENGGYGGGPGQIAHLATTYAAVMALCIVGTEHAYNSVNREALLGFLKRMKQADGGFRMHDDGEVDIRGAYCASVIATITSIASRDPQLFDKTAEWVVSCQTYEGGFSACPDAEAHGGYTFCGVATLLQLGRQHLLHMDSLVKWLAFKQMRHEGGFQGRTGKLVDSCYSYWQCATVSLLSLANGSSETDMDGLSLYDTLALSNYILVCCQDYHGGLKDKPGKNRDYYHTCYALSGLTVTQTDGAEDAGGTKLVRINPIYNISLENYHRAMEYFKKQE